MLALSRLSDKDLLSAAEFGRLISAYRFLRNLEHRLQIRRGPSDAFSADLAARVGSSGEKNAVRRSSAARHPAKNCCTI